MQTTTLVVGELSTNCYLVYSDDECLIIDPGDDADFITQTIIDQKLKPVGIVLTHGHYDHVLGCLELKLNFSIPIYLNQKDQKIYNSANQSAKYWQKYPGLKVPPIDKFIKEGDKIKFGSEELTVLETPGHTPGSISLIAASCQPPAVFTGDTLFSDTIGDTSHSYSSPSDLTKSLKKLKSLYTFPLSKGESKGVFTLFPGHGSAFTPESLTIV